MEYAGTQENGSNLERGHVAPAHQAAAGTAAANAGIPLLADANNVVLLPEGATLDDISVRGRDLVITLDDGRIYVIADGAVFVPQIVIDGVSVPPMNLAALLTSDEPQPAAGPVSSSGGNFADAVNPIQDAFELGNLLPYTELAFPEPREEEIYPGMIDRDEEPTIAITTPNQPAGVQAAASTVHEAGLSARGNKPAGTDAQADSETTTGTITFNAPDGLASIALNGVAITGVGQTFTTDQGVLTITSISGGSIGYSYTLTDNVLGPPADEVFVATVTDADGDTATATLTITITDDAPIARPDVDSVTEDGPLVADGNVLTGSGGSDANGNDGVADTQGADGAVVSTTGTFVGQYGTLVLNSDGSYVYTLDNTNPYVQALSEGETLTEVFPYTLADGDGDTSETTLTITINGANDGVVINGLDVTGGEIIVDEDNLASGSSPDAGALTQTGSFTVTSPDGLADVTVGGVVVVSGGVFTPQSITTPQGVLTITGFTPTTGAGGVTGGTFTYSYELTTNTPAHGAVGEDSVSDSFPVVVTDRDGSCATASLDVTVVDDVPTARDDAAISVAEDFVGTVGGNVLANDTQGADGAMLTAVTIAGSTTAIAAVGTTTVTTANGVYVFDATGAWTFDPANGLDNAAGIDASFTYVITDGDGDQATATQPITITDGDKPTAGAPISLVLDDQNLASGSTPAGADSATATIAFTPGSDAIANIAFATDLSGLGGGLTWTRIFDTQIVGTDGTRPVVTLDLVRVGNGAQVTATLDGNYADHAGINIDDVAELGSIGVVATDTDGDTAAGTVNLSVSDDLPQVSASADGAPALVVDETAFATDASASFAGAFTVNYGADGAGGVTYALAVTAGQSGLVDTLSGQPVILSLTVGGVVEGRTGSGDLVFTVTVDANGVVTLDQQRAVQHSDTGDHDDAATLSAADLVRLTATVTDGDGDTASASVNIGDKLQFRDDGPSIDAVVTDGDAVLLTTQDAETIGDASDTSVSSANFSGAFSLAHSSHGADGAGTVTWSFALSVTNPVSGLTSNGAAIALSLNAGVVEGRTAAGDLIFTLQTDANGVVTLTQHAEIDHAPNNGTAPYDTQLAVLGNGLVQLSGTATITDRDGDSASETVHLDLGGNVRFADDGPAISTTGAVIKVTVDESYFPYDASASFASAFAVNHGADGAGSVTYALAVTAGPSGLVDTLSGQPVILSLTAGGAVEGRTGAGDLVFIVTVDANGVVTLDQQRAVQHSDTSDHDDAATLSAADLVRLTATVTDGDGDTASATANIGDSLVFRDAGPSIDIVASGMTLVVDESLGTAGSVQNEGGAANNDEAMAGAAPGAIGYASGILHADAGTNAGSDGLASQVYSLAVGNTASGLVDTLSNQDVVLTLTAGGVVEGRTAIGNHLVFSLAVDSETGEVHLNQFRAVKHNDSSDHDENGDSAATLLAGRVSLEVTLTDGDGDTARDSIDISTALKFEDDGPLAVADSGVVTEVVQDFNAVFVLDMSGSINSTEYITMMNAVKAAVGQLFDTTSGDVTVRFVPFSTSATASVSFTSEAAALAQIDAYIANRPMDGNTNFTAAIDATMQHFAPDVSAENLVFFLSDGNPNRPNNLPDGSALTSGTATAWQNFVDTNGISVTAIGVGNGIDNGMLQQIDVDGTGEPILVSDFDDLIAALVDSLPPAAISGDLDANDDFGTDGGRIQSITIGSDTYTWNGASAISVSGGGTLPGTSISVDTPLGGKLTFDFASGVWSYKAPASVDATTDEVFNYTIVDGDGDTAASTLTITVRNDSAPSTAPVTATVDEDGLPGGIAGGADDLNANLGADGVAGGGDDDLDGPASSEATFSGVLGITYGDDGPGTVSFAQLHGKMVAVGVETATLTWDAASKTLTATGPRGALFTVELTNESTGAYKVTLLDNVLHASGQAENDATVALTYRVTDGNGTAGTGVLNIVLDDDKPGIFNTSEISLGSGLSSTGVFTYGIGADSRSSFSTSNGDFTSVALSGSVGSSAITNVTTTKTGETATGATFSFSFSYDADPSMAGMQAATSSGSISFNKSTGQYTFTLDQPLANYDTVTTSSPIAARESYNLAGQSASQPEVVVSQLDTDFFVRFSGIDGNLNAGGNGTFASGETIGGSQGWVSVSGTANGVSSDTLQRGEVLNLDFYSSNPGAAAVPGRGTARADGIFLKVDDLGSTEDLVVILKLVGPDGATTTRAVIVDAGDIWKAGTPNPYNIAYGNADGIVIIEGNDYNFGGDTYQIYGVQVLSSTTGLSLGAGQSAINLNRGVGPSGASAFNDNFVGTDDNDVIKIVDIGLIQRSPNVPEFSLDIDVTITDTDGDAVSSTLQVTGGTPSMADSTAGLLADATLSADRQSREAGRAVETAAVAAAASALIAATLTADVPPAQAAADPRPAPQGVEAAPAVILSDAEDSQGTENHNASDLLDGTGGPVALDAPETTAGSDAVMDTPTELTSVVDHAETAPVIDHQPADPEPAIGYALGDGAGTMQAMEALLALQAPPTPGDNTPGDPQAAEMPVVEEALAEARDAAFVDVLIDRLGGSADHAGPAAPQEGADIAQALSAHVDGGTALIQSAFDLAQMTHDASAQAAAQHV